MSTTSLPVPAPGVRGPAGSGRAALQDLPVLTWLPVAAMGALGVLALAAPAVASAWAWPLAVAGVLVGVPHGAVDHLVPWWWSARTAPARSLVAFTLAYAAVAALALTAFLVVPVPTVVAFLVLSALHFGRGEVVAWAERSGRPLPSPGGDALPAAAAGTTVVGALLWADPAVTDPLLRAVVPGVADAVLDVRAPALIGIAVIVLLAVGRLVASRRRADAAELLVVAVVFAVAPPLAAFGVWFGAWHALRHTGRLLDLAHAAEQRAGGRSDRRAAAARLARAGWLPTAVALAAVGTLWSMRDVAPLEAQISVLLALTFPHAAVVWALDRRGTRPSAR